MIPYNDIANAIEALDGIEQGSHGSNARYLRRATAPYHDLAIEVLNDNQSTLAHLALAEYMLAQLERIELRYL